MLSGFGESKMHYCYFYTSSSSHLVLMYIYFALICFILLAIISTAFPNQALPVRLEDPVKILSNKKLRMLAAVLQVHLCMSDHKGFTIFRKRTTRRLMYQGQTISHLNNWNYFILFLTVVQVPFHSSFRYSLLYLRLLHIFLKKYPS